MFKKNEGYKQQNLFGVANKLTKRQLKMWESSKEHKFFTSVFSKIDEERFRVLYSDKKSRPNVAVNQLVGSLILKHLHDWTYEELFSQMSFNMLSRHAIGIDDWQEDIFAPASLYNFQNKVIAHYLESGQDLFMEVFDSLTSAQLKEFGVSTDIQRGDSFLMGSNIIDYTRLNLLLEVLLRLHRILNESDQERFEEVLSPYTQQKASQYIYRLEKEDFPKELDKLGVLYHQLYTTLKSDYQDQRVFKIFTRVYVEHFEVLEEQIKVVPSKELHSGILMSPDDDEATYRNKGKVNSKGYAGHISETANPENELNLITDLAVHPNNVDDAKILEERLPEMIKKTPDLEEYHADGLYGNQEVDKMMTNAGIKQVQSTIRGRKSKSGLRIHKAENGEIILRCNGGQSVLAVKKVKTWRAEFDYSICQKCPFKDQCNTRETRMKSSNPARYTTFEEKAILAHQRFSNIDTIPESRRKVRANVEATVKEAKRGMNNNKIRVRGLQKAKHYLIWTSIAINLTRITRLGTSKKHFWPTISLIATRKQEVWSWMKNRADKLFAGLYIKKIINRKYEVEYTSF